MAAPACAAAMASAAICAGVIGRCGDMLGTWIDPVMAQLMITGFGIVSLSVFSVWRRA
jgi:hypothetical protein